MMKEQIYGYIVKDDNGDILLFKNKPTMDHNNIWSCNYNYGMKLPVSCFHDTDIKPNVVRKVKLGIRLLATSVPREDYLRDRISCNGYTIENLGRNISASNGNVKIVGKLSAVHNHIFGYKSQGRVDVIELYKK
jgi:hypothetical protein